MKNSGKKLPLTFYLNPLVTDAAKQLLGKRLVHSVNGIRVSGRIVETEAYNGVVDRASHAFNGKRTPRNETMYARGGTAYVYICYGIHVLFNVVTNVENIPHAVLIRGIEPVEGIDQMLQNRKMSLPEYRLTAGPGALTQAMGISRKHDGLQLTDGQIFIEEDIRVNEGDIISSRRVGVEPCWPDCLLPYRFRIRGSKWASAAK